MSPRFFHLIPRLSAIIRGINRDIFRDLIELGRSVAEPDARIPDSHPEAGWEVAFPKRGRSDRMSAIIRNSGADSAYEYESE